MPVPALLAFLGAGTLGAGALGLARLTRKPPQPATPVGPPSPMLLPKALPAVSLLSARAANAAPPVQLTAGRYYRVWTGVPVKHQDEVRAAAPVTAPSPQAYLTAVVQEEVERLGFSHTRLTAKDPTDDTTWTLITRWDGADGATVPDNVLHADLVPDPPPTAQPAPPVLDHGMTVDEVEAVRYALARDDDPKHLGGFAFTMQPDYPIAFSLLKAKETLAAAVKEPPAQGAVAQAAAQVSGAVGAELRRVGWIYPPLTRCVVCRPVRVRTAGFEFSDITDPVLDAAKDIPGVGDVTEELRKVSKDLGDAVTSAWDKFGGAVETLGPILGTVVTGPQVWMVETAFKSVKALIEGHDVSKVLSEQGARFAQGLQQMSPYVAMIPGLGTGIAVMMNAAAAIALAQPLGDAALDTLAAAVPGGPICQDAFRGSVAMGSAMLRGERVDQAALEGARAAIPSEEGRIAFDAGLALARGKSLQDAGFQALYQWTNGNDLVDRAAHFTESVIKAKQEGRNVSDVLIDEAQHDLVSAVTDEPARQDLVNRYCTAFVQNPDLLKNFPFDVARALQKPTNDPVLRGLDLALRSMGIKRAGSGDVAAARAAMQAAKAFPGPASAIHLPFGMKIVAKDIVIVDKKILARVTTKPKALGKAKPKATPVARSPIAKVTAAALQLVQATRRPEMSRVANPSAVAGKIADIVKGANAGDQDALKAKAALDRATIVLERRKWVEWYKRVLADEASAGPPPPAHDAGTSASPPAALPLAPPVAAPKPVPAGAAPARMAVTNPALSMLRMRSLIR